MHYAKLAQLAGVDVFLIGSEMRGLTSVRERAASFPALAALRALAGDVRALVGAETIITYAADWSEYFGHQPQDGSGDVLFHLDPLWADENIDVVGVDWYPPLSDWRDGANHLDAALAPAIHDGAYLQSRIEAGEGYDWYYASPEHRAAQTRTPITDGAYSEPWIYRAKDVRNFWARAHYNRPGGVRAGAPTAWIAQSKPIWLIELGCPAIDKGANAPNLF
ncbi:MAG TPA: glycoside hydrolase TIM-barrel-like domain-containing protein, partial [Terricaulis sp.]|nr:glycoside hydrolase TIM-barrel-like domain-containing protein [Terricaulis sp.]